MSVHNHFYGSVNFLIQTVFEHQPHGYIRFPESVFEVYDAIEFIGEYMGRDDISRLADPLHVLHGYTIALNDAVWVLAEVQKFREWGGHVPFGTSIRRWLAWLRISPKCRYPHG